MKKKVVVPPCLTDCGGCGRRSAVLHAYASLGEGRCRARLHPPGADVAGTVAQHDVPIYLTGVGTVIAFNTDVVRAQIQGQIISINFTEGRTVHAGDLLGADRPASLTKP